jgi:DNA-binding transcriptional ArsR family regulator
VALLAKDKDYVGQRAAAIEETASTTGESAINLTFAYKRTVEIIRFFLYHSAMRVLLHPAKSQITLANVLFALSDPTRLRIVKAISEYDQMNCCDIELNLSKSTASRHFRVLREAGVIRMEPHGVVCNNSLRRHDLEECFPGLLDSVLQAMASWPRVRRKAKAR